MAQKTIYIPGNPSSIALSKTVEFTFGIVNPKTSFTDLQTTVSRKRIKYSYVGNNAQGEPITIEEYGAWEGTLTLPSTINWKISELCEKKSGYIQQADSETITFTLPKDDNILTFLSGEILGTAHGEAGSTLAKEGPRSLTTEELENLKTEDTFSSDFYVTVGRSSSQEHRVITYECSNCSWTELLKDNTIQGTPFTTTWLFDDGIARTCAATPCTQTQVWRGSSSNVIHPTAGSEQLSGSVNYKDIQLKLTVEYEDAPIKVTSTLDKDTYAADTSFALNITNQNGENTVTTAKCTAEFLHTRGESVTPIWTLTDFTPYSYAQLLPYDPNDNKNFVTRVQRLFEYIPDTWKTDTELLVFKPGDIYTIKLTVSEYTVDDVEYTDKPVEAIFEYTIGEGVDIQVSTPVMTSPTEANKNNISETASLTFSLPGQVGTYAVEKIEWMATLAGPNFTTTPLQLTQTGSNIPTETPPLGTATFEIPSEERAKITKNVEYTLTITAVATTVDGKSAGEQITTITGCIFKPADYTLNFTIPALQDKKKIYSGEEIALNFGLVKTTNNEAINGLTYHLTISAGANTETYSVTNANTYTWRNSALPGAITYNFTCATQYNSQDYTANITINPADYPTYAKLIGAKNLSFSDNGLLYYNTDTVPVTYELVIPNSATTEKFVVTTSLNDTALIEQTIENNAKIFTTSGSTNIPLTIDPYVNYRGKVDVKFVATAREDIDSAYIDEDFKELTLSFAIRSPECEYVYPAEEGLVSCIANPIFRLKSTKGTFSRGTGYVGTPNYPGVWIEVPLEFPDNNDLTECTFKWPFAVEDNTTYDVYFKEVLNSDVVLNDSMKNISPSKVTRWTADLINKTLVNAAGYRLLEKYSYRKLLANLLQWKGTKIDYSVADNESQLAILIDLFGTSGYTEIRNAINNYGIDSPQAWNAFMKALL